MNSALRFPLNTSPAQHAQLVKLQQSFAEVCNALAPLVQQTRCWNRVALHHMAYKQLGVRYLIAVSAVGSLREDYAPGHVVIPDQLFDRTKGNRAATFFGDGVVAQCSKR